MGFKFKPGDKVKWISVPRTGNVRGTPVKCTGVVESVGVRTLGGSKRAMGATIMVTSKGLHKAKNGMGRVRVSFINLVPV